MNPWFEAFVEGIPGGRGLELTREEAKLVLDVAGEAAHTAGARQFAPLATYLAGRAAAGDAGAADRLEVLRAAAAAAAAAGRAGAPLDLD